MVVCTFKFVQYLDIVERFVPEVTSLQFQVHISSPGRLLPLHAMPNCIYSGVMQQDWEFTVQLYNFPPDILILSCTSVGNHDCVGLTRACSNYLQHPQESSLKL